MLGGIYGNLHWTTEKHSDGIVMVLKVAAFLILSYLVFGRLPIGRHFEQWRVLYMHPSGFALHAVPVWARAYNAWLVCHQWVRRPYGPRNIRFPTEMPGKIKSSLH